VQCRKVVHLFYVEHWAEILKTAARLFYVEQKFIDKVPTHAISHFAHHPGLSCHSDGRKSHRTTANQSTFPILVLSDIDLDGKTHGRNARQ